MLWRCSERVSVAIIAGTIGLATVVYTPVSVLPLLVGGVRICHAG